MWIYSEDDYKISRLKKSNSWVNRALIDCMAALQLGSPGYCAVKFISLVILLPNSQIRELGRHDPARGGTFHQSIAGEIRHTCMVAEKVFVEECAAVDMLRGSADDCQYRIGENSRLTELAAVSLWALGGC